MSRFQDKLDMGISAENIVFQYLVANNSYVEDLRQHKHGEFVGPRLVGTEGRLVLPDFLVYNKLTTKGTYAVDVKSKSSLYNINGIKSFTVDDKYLEYINAAQIKRMDYLALIFLFEDRMYMYKEFDCKGIHKFSQNKYGNGNVFYFQYDRSKIVF